MEEYVARIMPVADDPLVITDEAVRNLVGTSPLGAIGGTIVDAWIESGWVYIRVRRRVPLTAYVPPPVGGAS